MGALLSQYLYETKSEGLQLSILEITYVFISRADYLIFFGAACYVPVKRVVLLCLETVI